MAQTVGMIGLQDGELQWVRLLVALLRHPDPFIAELARHALEYAQSAAAAQGLPNAASE